MTDWPLQLAEKIGSYIYSLLQDFPCHQENLLLAFLHARGQNKDSFLTMELTWSRHLHFRNLKSTVMYHRDGNVGSFYAMLSNFSNFCYMYLFWMRFYVLERLLNNFYVLECLIIF